MRYKSARIVCFSPTRTVRKITKSIAKGIGLNDSEIIDITLPESRKNQLQLREDELLIIGTPVYVGRVPSLVTEWINSIKANNTPVVCVTVYGNRDYDDALLELKNSMKQQGFIPIAFGAFIGEHSFSSKEYPASVGRPDESDLNSAESFGLKILEKLKKYVSAEIVEDINLPGVFPYRGDIKTWVVDFIEVSDKCSQCGLCAKRCPVAAIDLIDSSIVNIEKCILCCACIKNCPENARKMKPGLMRDAAARVSEKFSERKEPVIFI